MSGSLKLKIKLKPRPQETDPASEKSDHKRKLGDYSSQHPSLPSATGDHSEVRRSKKQKQHHPANPPLHSTGSVPKVKLHIKGPWNKAASASENKDSPLRQASSGQPFQSQPPSKSSLGHPVLSIKQRPPAKAVQNLGQADAAAPAKAVVKKTKLKGFEKGKQHQADTAPDDTESKGAAASKDSSERHNLEAAEASVGQPPKSEGHGLLAVPTRSVLERIVDKVQRKDNFNIFRDPITEAVAPGYFSVVQRAMDFTTMRAKVQGDSYSAWQQFEDDMDVMFDNAMVYNTPDTVYYKQARSLKALAAKMVGLAKQGVTDFRGKTVAESRAHNAQIAAEQQAYREEQRGAKATSLATKVAEQFAGGGAGMTLRHAPTTTADADTAEPSSHPPPRMPPRVHRPVVRESDMRKFAGQEEQNNRATYWQVPAAPHYTRWKGLSAGATAESVALHPGRPLLRPVVMPNKDTYARSIARFTSKLKGQFKQLVQARLSPAFFAEQALLSQGLQSAQPSAPSNPGMAAAVPGPVTSSAHHLASASGRPVSTLNAMQTGGHSHLTSSAGLPFAAGSRGIALGQPAAPQPAARPASMPYNTGQTYSVSLSNRLPSAVQQHM